MITRELEQHFQQKEIEEPEIKKVSTLNFNEIINQGHVSRKTYSRLSPKQLIELGRANCDIKD